MRASDSVTIRRVEQAWWISFILHCRSKTRKISTTNTVNQERPKQASRPPNGPFYFSALTLFWSLWAKRFVRRPRQASQIPDGKLHRSATWQLYKLQLCHRKFRCIDERRRIGLASSSMASRNASPSGDATEAAHQNGLESDQFPQFMRHQIGRMLSQSKMQTRDFIRNNGILIGSWYQSDGTLLSSQFSPAFLVPRRSCHATWYAYRWLL